MNIGFGMVQFRRICCLRREIAMRRQSGQRHKNILREEQVLLEWEYRAAPGARRAAPPAREWRRLCCRRLVETPVFPAPVSSPTTAAAWNCECLGCLLPL